MNSRALLFTSPQSTACYHAIKACGGGYLSIAFHISMCVCSISICHNNHAVGMRTVGVKVNADNTKIYVQYFHKNHV